MSKTIPYSIDIEIVEITGIGFNKYLASWETSVLVKIKSKDRHSFDIEMLMNELCANECMMCN